MVCAVCSRGRCYQTWMWWNGLAPATSTGSRSLGKINLNTCVGVETKSTCCVRASGMLHCENFNIFQTVHSRKVTSRRMSTVQDFWMRAARAVRQGAARFSMNAVQSHGESGTTIMKRMIGEDSKLARNAEYRAHDSNAIESLNDHEALDERRSIHDRLYGWS